jgi:hypothetical protein
MQLKLPEHAPRTQVLRYLGAGSWQPDANADCLLADAEKRLLPVCTPRGVWRALPFSALPLERAGRDLARHLAGCDSMILMAVTLGAQVDKTLRRLCLTDVALGAAADATASALAEAVCDELEQQIRVRARAEGKYLTGRFSPGYGDCPLALQQELCLALDTARGMGTAPTPDHLLSPRKSITAILGVARSPVTGTLAGCEHCLLREKCEDRKRGNYCAKQAER